MRWISSSSRSQELQWRAKVLEAQGATSGATVRSSVRRASQARTGLGSVGTCIGLSHDIYTGMSHNRGSPKPWVVLQNMIIIGGLLGTPITRQIRIHLYVYIFIYYAVYIMYEYAYTCI